MDETETDLNEDVEEYREKGTLRAIGWVVTLFGGFSMFSALFFTSQLGAPIKGKLTKEGGLTEAFVTPKKNTVVKIEVQQPILRDNNWSFVTGEILDSEQELLFSFAEELWRETGYSEGQFWRETKNKFDLKVTLPDPGTYYIHLETERKPIRNTGGRVYTRFGDVYWKVTALNGSTVPIFAGGLIGLIFGVILLQIAKSRNAATTPVS